MTINHSAARPIPRRAALSLIGRNGGIMALGCLLLPAWGAQGASLPQIDGAQTFLYSRDRRTLLGHLQIGRVFKSFKKVGFFRIGLFPIVVMEGVLVDLHQAGHAVETVSSLAAWTNRHTPEACEFRNVQFKLRGEEKARLAGGLVDCSRPGFWDIEQAVFRAADGNNIAARKASLAVSGRNAGLITFTADGEIVEVQLSSLFSQGART